MTKFNDYIGFKINQFIRITGFDIKQDGAKEELKARIAPLMREWTAEAIAAGC